MAGIKASSLEQRQVNRCITGIKGDLGIRVAKDQSLQWMLRPVYINNRFAPRLRPLIKTIAFNTSDYSIDHMTVKLAIEQRLTDLNIKTSRDTVKFIQFLPLAVQLNVDGMDNRWIVQVDTVQAFDALIRHGLLLAKRHIVIRSYALLQEIEIEIWKMLNEQRQLDEAAAVAIAEAILKKQIENNLTTCVERDNSTSGSDSVDEDIVVKDLTERVVERSDSTKFRLDRTKSNLRHAREVKESLGIETTPVSMENEESSMTTTPKPIFYQRKDTLPSIQDIQPTETKRRQSIQKSHTNPALFDDINLKEVDPTSSHKPFSRFKKRDSATMHVKTYKRTESVMQLKNNRENTDFYFFNYMYQSRQSSVSLESESFNETKPNFIKTITNLKLSLRKRKPQLADNESDDESDLSTDVEETENNADHIQEEGSTEEELSDEDNDPYNLLRPSRNLDYSKAFNYTLL